MNAITMPRSSYIDDLELILSYVQDGTNVEIERFTRFDPGHSHGHHVIIEMYGGQGTDNPEHIHAAFVGIVEMVGAKMLNYMHHHFAPCDTPDLKKTGYGVTALGLLSESHISIHSWPENDYAAMDIYTCGKSDPEKGIPAIIKHFRPRILKVKKYRRG